ncbi:internal virion protein B [Aeromonas phage vB_AspA_Tola]|nr:internal virion protein B [Aeromonas phage vB_AspA_Tola]
MATVERQQVAGLQRTGLPAQRSAQVINRMEPRVQQIESSAARASRIIDGLAGMVDSSSELAYKQAQIDVETKKVAGMSTALSGGKLGEEVTKAEQSGYDLVTSQSDLLKVNERLARTIQENPEMSDDDFNRVKEQQYGQVLQKYQNADKDVFKAISVKAQESQLAMYSIQKQAQEGHRQFKAQETMNYNIGNQLDSAKTVQDGQALIKQYLAQGKALGLGEDKTKDMLFDHMVVTASQGDDRLLKFVSATDWGKYSKSTAQANQLYAEKQKRAQAEYEAAIQKQNVFSYGSGLAELETMAKSGAGDAELMQKMKELQSAGLKFSPSSVAGYLTMGKTVNASQQALSSNVKVWQDNKGQFSLAQNPYIQSEDKKKVLKAAEDAIVSQSDQVPPEQRADFTISNLLQLSRQEDMPVATIGTALTSLANIDTQQPMTPSVGIWTKYLLAADEQTIKLNVPDTKQQKFLMGMRDTLINSQGQDADTLLPTAITQAQLRRDNVTTLTSQQTRKVNNLSSDAVGTLKDPTITSFHFWNEDLPLQTQDYITSKINTAAQSNYGLFQNTEKAVQAATTEFQRNNMILTGGVVANVGVSQLSRQVPELIQPGDDSTDLQKRAVSALDYQVDTLLKEQADKDGLEYKREDAQLLFSNQGNTYQVMVGGLVVGTYFTKGLAEKYNEDYYKKWTAEQDRQQKKSYTTRGAKTGLDISLDTAPMNMQ